jgi:hypothetical protein
MTSDLESRQIMVCGRYPLSLLKLPGQSKHSYFKYLRNAEKNSLCTEQLLLKLPKGISVVEHFGGVGMTGVMIQHLLEPSTHQIFDVDTDCVTQLQYVFGRAAQYGDAKELMGTVYADLITCDFPDFTFNKKDEWPLERLFSIRPKYVLIADIARQRIGVHRNLWTRLVGRPIFNYEDYLIAMSEYFHKNYGYSIELAASHVHSFLLITPGKSEIEFWKLGA